jgi:hypothetical protein
MRRIGGRRQPAVRATSRIVRRPNGRTRTLVDDEALVVGAAQLVDDQLTLSAGRKRHVRVRVV